MKVRLDKLILQRGLAPSRERAQALVLAGRVLVNEQKVEKSGANVDDLLRCFCELLNVTNRALWASLVPAHGVWTLGLVHSVPM